VNAEISTLVLVAICAAYIFDFLNGFHDAANSIATVVSTRVLSPRAAVAWAAFFNFVAFKFFALGVASTVGKGIIDPKIVDANVILAALSGAIVWNIVTWLFGIPSSSSHALIGGLVGAGFARAGAPAVVWTGIASWSGLSGAVKTMVVSPALGLLLGFLLMVAVLWIFRRWTPMKVDRLFRRLQFLSAAAYSLGHGGGDAQKTMGVIWVLLISVGVLPAAAKEPPLWIVVSCHAAMGLGTLFGGWRIVHTMGSKITKLKPVGGFCAETAGALTLFANIHFKLPVSTTHVITGSIMGVGATRRLSAVRWGVTGRIVTAWILTIPASAAVAMASYVVIRALGV
jgi:PiT family inorganic phosphate transporter